VALAGVRRTEGPIRRHHGRGRTSGVLRRFIAATDDRD